MIQHIITIIVSIFLLGSPRAALTKSDASTQLNNEVNLNIIKTLAETKRGSLQGYSEAVTKRPILEILYAWQGYDQWEAVGVRTSRDKYGNASVEGSAYQPVGMITNNDATDVTTAVRTALNKGGIYITRKKNPVLTCQSDSDNPYVANKDNKTPEQSWANDRADEWVNKVGGGQSDLLAAIKLSFCMGPQPMAPSKGRTSNKRYVSPSLDRRNGDKDAFTAAETAVTNAAKAMELSAAISGISVTKDNAIFSDTDKTLGIIYRDASGIHFRRFEGWQNIALPMVTSCKVLDQDSSSGQMYYHHQFEELGRGLITFTAKGSTALSIIATDRFGWQNTEYKGTTLYPGVLQPIHGFGPDLKIFHPAQTNMAWDVDRRCYASNELASSDQLTSFDPFNFVWDSSGSYINLKPGGYGIMWQDGQLPLFSTVALQYYSAAKQYRYFDANNALQTLPIGSNVDPSIGSSGTNKLVYPGSVSAETNLWFAFDRTPSGMTFMVGSGTPTSESDWSTTAPNPSARLLYQSTLNVSPYLRNFGFRSTNNLGAGFTPYLDKSLLIANIESRPLNPGSKFCTPPFSKQKFLFWRKEWTLPASDYFSLKFKAAGDSINVAFGAKNYAQRTAGTTMDTGYTYSVNINNSGITIQKFDKGILVPAAAQPVLNADIKPTKFLGGDDKTVFFPYWITYANGVFEVGQSEIIGQNVIAQATDATPTNTSVSYCFSSDIRPTDYININAASYQATIDTSTTATETLGAYTDWSASRTFSTPGRGALLFSYKGIDESSTPLMLGLLATLPAKTPAGNSAAAVTPDYQIVLGTQNNNASEIKQKSTTVFTQTAGTSPDGTPLKMLINDNQWHDLWMAYNNGTIAYGSGSQVGVNLIGSWKDAAPTPNIKAFSFTSPANSLQIRINGIAPIDDHTVYQATADAAPVTKALWQTLTPNRGAINFTAACSQNTGAIVIGLKSSTQGINDAPHYDLVINDANTAYIKKNSVKQLNSVITLTTAQQPSATGTNYWAAWRDGIFLVGTGSNPLDTNSTLLQWQDPTFTTAPTAPITLFTLSAAKQLIKYSNIGFVPFTAYESAFSNSNNALQDRTAIQTAWLANPTQLDLKPSTGQSLYWHSSLLFNQPGQTAITFSAQKKSSTPLQILIGLSDIVPTTTGATQLNGAQYYIAINDDGSVTAATGTGAPIATVAGSHALFKKLADGLAHTVWINITQTAPNVSTITLGIDSKIGVNPLVSGTLPTDSTILNAFGFGANANTVSFSQIAAAPFNDPTRCTTPDTGVFTWQDTWSFAAPDQEKINFTVTALNPTTKTLSLVIGLGLDNATTPANATQFNNAEYVISIDYTGQIALFKKPNYSTKLGSVRYADQGDTAKQALVKTLASGNPCRCSVAYDAGRIQLILGDSTIIWDYTDTEPTLNISRFSFSSIKSSAQISAISTMGGQSLRSLEQLFNLLPATLANNAASVADQIQDAVTNRLINGKEAYFLTGQTSVVNTLVANKELFSDADRTKLASLLTDAAFDISTTNKPLIQAAITALTSSPAWITLCANYKAQIGAVFGDGSASAKPLAATDTIRLLFVSKLAKLGSLPDATLAAPGLLPAIQDLANAFTPVLSILTATETPVITKLQTLARTANILKNLQDPDGILNLAAQLINTPQQVTAIQTLIAGRYASNTNTVGAPVVPTFTTTQCTKITALLESIINNRDELGEDDKKTMNVVLQTCRVIPELLSLKTALTGLSIDALSTLLTTTVSDADQLKKLVSRVNGIAVKASTEESRQLFFKYLNNFISAQPAKDQSLLNELNTKVLTPLQAIPLSGDESTLLAAATTMVTTATNTNKSFTAQLKNAQATIATLENYIAFLQQAMQSKGINTIFTATDFDSLITEIAYVVDSRELLKSTDSLVNLIRTAQLLPEMATHKDDLTSLITEATTGYPFADRIAYMKTEIPGIVSRKQANPTSTAIDQPYARLIQKLAIINTAPGIKTEAAFNDLDTAVLSQIIALSTDTTIIAQLQKIRADLLTSKQDIILQQTKFSYHFAAAQEQKASTSIYISLLKDIIENERKGLVTFTGSDSTTYITALSELVATRDSLISTDLATLATAINYAVYSNTYKDQATTIKTLNDLYTQVNTPLSFIDRVTKYTTMVTQIIRLLPTDAARVAYFKTLNTLFDAPGEHGSQAITQLQNSIITPLLASPLSDNEKATIQGLQTFVVSAQQNNKTAAYQLQQISILPTITDVISGLSDILKRKGISVIFTADDFTTLLDQITYLVDNRELIQVNAVNKDSNAINNLTNLIRTALLAPELASSKDTLNTLLTTATTQHTFSDRVAYAAKEISALITTHTANATTDFDYLYNRLITKLTIILDAPGLKTEELFNTLELNILTPLIQLATSEQQQAQLQTVRTTILNNKSTILAQQNTFAYQFTATQAQQDNLSIYIGMLKDIIANERQGTVTFDINKGDGQTYITALTAILAARDLLNTNDLSLLQEAINFALFSKTFTVNQSQISTLQQLLTLTSTPIPFNDRVATYSQNTMAIIAKPTTDAARITFFVGLRNLLSAPGLRTNAALTSLQTAIINPLTSSPLSTSETATLNDLKSFLIDAQKQVQSASYQLQQLQALDWNSYIAGMQDLLTQKGVGLQFTIQDFDLFMANLRYIVNNRELIQVGNTVSLLTTNADSLLRAAQLAPELAQSKNELAQLIIDLTLPHTFTDRIAYMKNEVLMISQLLQANSPASLDYWYDRLISKLSSISTAPGTKTEDLFNDIEMSIINPLLKLITDATRDQSLQTIRTQLAQNKAAIIKAQTTFQYHFDAAQDQKNNVSAYVSLLKDIISNERKGNITFNGDTNDGKTFIDALTALLNNRDLLSPNDLSLLKDILNFALFSKVYTSNQTQLNALQQLLTLTDTPIPFADRVAKYSKNTTTILTLQNTDPIRINFFTGLRGLLNAPGVKTAAIITTLQNMIITPLVSSPLAADEKAVVTNLNTFVINAQTQVQSANYQMQQLQSADWSTYITGLQSLLTQKGVSLQFNASDFEAFMAHLRYIVNNRELLQTSSNASSLTRSVDTLLRTAQLVPEMASSKADIAELIINLTAPHSFSDRISYIKTEISAIAQLTQASSDFAVDYWYDRLLLKLTSITNAPGTKTEDLFNDIEISIINPLLKMITDTARLQSLQTIRTTLTQNKAAILQAQTTFQYHFDAAQEQIESLSTYLGMLQEIIAGERKGTITFDNTKTPSDATTFLNALTAVAALRDGFTTNDNATLTTTLNYALFSNSFASIAALKNQLQQLLTIIATPVPFVDRVTLYSSKVMGILALSSTDTKRITFFKNLQSLMDAPGLKTPESITQLNTTIITPLVATPLNDDEQRVVKNLQSFLTTTQSNAKTAGYQINILQTQADLLTYIAGLQDLLTRKGTYFTFTKDDFQAFVNELKYVVNSRELLTGAGLTAAQNLVASTQLSTDFAPFASDLTLLSTQIKQPFYFNDRVTWMANEIQTIANRNVTATDTLLVRFIVKLGYLLQAPQQNTTDQQFNILDTNVLTPLSQLALSDDQKKTVETLRLQISAGKAQILLLQTTFKYYYDLAQTQIDNLDSYLTILRDAMIKQRDGSVTLSGNDSSLLLTTITTLVANRDDLTATQTALLKTLVNYSAYSTVYKGTTDAATLSALYQQINQPVALSSRIQKYNDKIADILFLDSTDAKRVQFFNQLNNLTSSTETLTPQLAAQLNTQIITKLVDTPMSFTEQAVIKSLQAYTATTDRAAQSVSFLLQIADDSNTDLYAYAQAVIAIMQQKGNALSFTTTDDTKVIAALTYVVASRELLSSDQIKSLLQLLNQIMWLDTFTAQKELLKSMMTDLQTPHLFSDCVSYLSQELKAMMVSKTAATSARMARYVAKLALILKATGPSVANDFDILQNTATQLQTLALPDAQKTTVANLMTEIITNRDSILAAQKTFSYNFNQAQLLQDNLTNYINALLAIITGVRQNTIVMQPADYATFANALLVISDQQDALSATDINTLKTVVNYTYYSQGFAANPQYQQQLLDINTALNTPVAFATRVAQYATTLTEIMQLDPTATARQRFFSKIKTLPTLTGSGIISDVEIFATKILTPLQATPLSDSEKVIVSSLATFVDGMRKQATTLSYNLKLMNDAIINTVATDGSQNPTNIMVNSLNDIITKRNAGAIQFAGNDYQQIIDLTTAIISNRELFNDAQMSTVQTMIRAIQFGAGFESFKTTLDTLYAMAATPLSFTERVQKYQKALPAINALAPTDQTRTQFITMVSTVMSAPGDRSVDMITQLENTVLNPIKFGNFTNPQKEVIAQILTTTSAEKVRLNGFTYRLSVARNSKTPSDYYKALTQMITDFTNGILLLGSADFTTMVIELDKLVTLRPLTPDTQSELFALVSMVRTAPTFATRADLANRLAQLNSIMAMPVDIPTRVNYFMQNTMALLSQPADSGPRTQFFTRLSNFGTEIINVNATILAESSIQTTLTQLSSALSQYQLSSNATAAEKTIFTALVRQLQDVTSNNAPAPIISEAATTINQTIVQNQSNTVLPLSSTVSRFYRAAPAGRYAQ